LSALPNRLSRATVRSRSPTFWPMPSARNFTHPPMRPDGAQRDAFGGKLPIQLMQHARAGESEIGRRRETVDHQADVAETSMARPCRRSSARWRRWGRSRAEATSRAGHIRARPAGSRRPRSAEARRQVRHRRERRESRRPRASRRRRRQPGNHAARYSANQRAGGTKASHVGTFRLCVKSSMRGAARPGSSNARPSNRITFASAARREPASA
jgi:hypothetical protein